MYVCVSLGVFLGCSGKTGTFNTMGSLSIVDIDFDVIRNLVSKIFIEDQLDAFALKLKCNLDLDVLVWNTVSVAHSVSFSKKLKLDEDMIKKVKSADFFKWEKIWPSPGHSKDSRSLERDSFEHHYSIGLNAQLPATLFGY